MTTQRKKNRPQWARTHQERDLLRKAQEVASGLGPDDALTGEVLYRFENAPA